MKEVDIINGVRFGGELYDLSSVLKKFQKQILLLGMFGIFQSILYIIIYLFTPQIYQKKQHLGSE